MAEVFKAKASASEGFEKVLVIKRILADSSPNSTRRFVDMFVHEAKLAVRLSHANIVQVFDLRQASTWRSKTAPRRTKRRELLHRDGVRAGARSRDRIFSELAAARR